MDKYEYKLRAEEIKSLIAKKKYVDAARVADTIDWNRVKNVSMLGTVSDLYKINRRFDDARSILEMANNRHPGGRTIIYSLCDLSIRMGDVVSAVEYYRQYAELVPSDDSSCYVLQYKLYEAQDVSLEERIAVLEKLKKKEYREKWGYELAYLYHRVGLATKCVEECDELILWFGEGKYVYKAMELKTLHQPLTAMQQQKFDAYMLRKQGLNVPDELMGIQQKEEKKVEDIQVKPMDMGMYNTSNLQQALAENVSEVIDPRDGVQHKYAAQAAEPVAVEEAPAEQETVYEAPAFEVPAEQEPVAMAEEAQPVYAEEAPAAPVYEAPAPAAAPAAYAAEETPAYAEPEKALSEEEDAGEGPAYSEETGYVRYASSEELVYEQPPYSSFSEEAQVDRQITGQMNLEDVLNEWEKVKKVNEEKNRRELQQRVMEQTGSLFRDFEVGSRQGVLEQLQKQERIPVSRREQRERKVVASNEIAAHTKVWAAEKVEEALRRQAAANAEAAMKQTVAAEAEAVAEAAEILQQAPAIPEAVLRAAEEADRAEALRRQEEQAALEAAQKAEAARKAAEEQAALEAARKAAEEAQAKAAAEQAALEAAKAAAEEAARKEAEEAAAKAAAEEAAQAAIRLQEEMARETAQKAAEEAVEEAVEEAPEAEPEEEPAEEPAEEPEAEAPAEETPAEEPQEAAEETPAEDSQEPAAETPAEEPAKDENHTLSKAEKRIFSNYIPTKNAAKHLAAALDGLSLAAFTGNLILSSDNGVDLDTLAKAVVRDMKVRDENFSGKMGKVNGASLNIIERDPIKYVEKLNGGALVIEEAGAMDADAAKRLINALNQENWGILVILMDVRRNIKKLLDETPELEKYFTARYDVQAMDDAALVNYACKYANSREFSIDEFGRLALSTRIADMQTADHAVTIADVRELVDAAIERAEKKSLKHVFAVVFGKRYDEEDMIIIHEKDFRY